MQYLLKLTQKVRTLAKSKSGFTFNKIILFTNALQYGYQINCLSVNFKENTQKKDFILYIY